MGNQITKQLIVDANASFNEHQGAERIGLFDSLGNPLSLGVVGEAGRLRYTFEVVVNAEDSVSNPLAPMIIFDGSLADLSTLPSVFKDAGTNLFGVYGEGSKNSFALPDGFGFGAISVTWTPTGPSDVVALLEWNVGTAFGSTLLTSSEPGVEETAITFTSGLYGTPDLFSLRCVSEAAIGSWVVTVDLRVSVFVPIIYTETIVD